LAKKTKEKNEIKFPELCFIKEIEQINKTLREDKRSTEVTQ